MVTPTLASNWCRRGHVVVKPTHASDWCRRGLPSNTNAHRSNLVYAGGFPAALNKKHRGIHRFRD